MIEQIATNLQNQDIFYYRTQAGAECDLVITKSRKPVKAVEVKNTSKPKVSRGFKSMIEDLGTEQNFIVTPEGGHYMADEKVRVCSLENFLEKYIG